MNLKSAIFPKIISNWTVIGLLPLLVVLVALIFNVVSSFFLTYEQLSSQSMVSGNVKLIDGSIVIQSGNSTPAPQYENTQSQLGKGLETASSVKLLDGSLLFVCMSQQALPLSFNSIRKLSPTGTSDCSPESFTEWRQRIFRVDR